MHDRKKEIENEVSLEFKRIEKALPTLEPGVMDALQVYGGYELAIQQAQYYMGLIDSSPTFISTGDSSNRLIL